jgi:DNA-binding LacI/PurR family transcriptional regulator
MGYTRPAVVTTPPTRSYIADILDTYGRWCGERDVSPLVVELAEPPTERAAARAAERLLTRRDRPDVIYATYDRLALGALWQAQQLGVPVPDDVGIASAVDSDALRWLSPHVTAAFLNPRRVGRQAVAQLIDLAEGRRVAPGVMVPSRVIVRASTRRASGAG